MKILKNKIKIINNNKLILIINKFCKNNFNNYKIMEIITTIMKYKFYHHKVINNKNNKVNPKYC